MIHFVLTRMWMYHGKVNERCFKKFSDTLAVKGQAILETPVNFANDNAVRGTIVARWRDFSREGEEGHNLYPCIDLEPDAATLSLLQRYFLNAIPECRLEDCRFRIMDYGYLNVLLVFAVDNPDGLAKINRQQAAITRKINAWIPTLDAPLDALQKEGYVDVSDDYFGIPLKLKNFLDIDNSDMYTYQDMTVLTSGSRELVPEVRKLYGINDAADCIEHYEIHGIDQSPVIAVEQELDRYALQDLVEPYNLLLAEINTYDSVSNLNYAIIKLMGVTDMSKKARRSRFRKTKEASAFDSFTSSDLRKVTINSHYILHCINFRKTAILPWQNLFLRKFKEKNPYEENKANFESSEAIIAKLIEEKTQESQKGHSNTLEVLFMLLSAITIYSTYVDVVAFLDSSHSNFSQIASNTLEVKIFLCITLVMGLIFVYIIRSKRRE